LLLVSHYSDGGGEIDDTGLLQEKDNNDAHVICIPIAASMAAITPSTPPTASLLLSMSSR
jgi:hypothetical protein